MITGEQAASREALAAAVEVEGAGWRTQLGAIWLTQFMAALGLTVIGPLLPILIARDLGLHEARQVDFWTGLVFGASGLTLAIASPVWGVIGDRFGRKLMLLRAVVMGGVVIGTMGLARSVYDLAGLRILQGFFSGSYSISTAIVAAESPRSRTGFALGVIGSAWAIGMVIGPAVAGLAAGLIGVRHVLELAGVVMVAAAIPVVFLVRDDRGRRRRTAAEADGTSARPLRKPGLAVKVGFLLLGQTLMSAMTSIVQPLLVLRLLELVPRNAASTAGIAFGIAGLSTATVSIATGWVGPRFGYRRLARAGSLLGILVLAGFAAASSAPQLLGLAAFLGAVSGLLTPSLNAMLGLETPDGTHGTVFGLAGSASALGFGGGPLLAGLLAARFTIPLAMLSGCVVGAALLAVLLFAVSEPAET